MDALVQSVAVPKNSVTLQVAVRFGDLRHCGWFARLAAYSTRGRDTHPN